MEPWDQQVRKELLAFREFLDPQVLPDLPVSLDSWDQWGRKDRKANLDQRVLWVRRVLSDLLDLQGWLVRKVYLALQALPETMVNLA
mgnify:FL=1